jgi:hypothetical protein
MDKCAWRTDESIVRRCSRYSLDRAGTMSAPSDAALCSRNSRYRQRQVPSVAPKQFRALGNTSFRRRCRSRICSCRWTRRCGRGHPTYSERSLCRRHWSPATSSAASDTQNAAIIVSASQARLASCEKTKVRSASQRLMAEKLAATTKRLMAKPTPARDVRGF